LPDGAGPAAEAADPAQPAGGGHAHEAEPASLLPGGIRVGGLFDAVYERGGFDGDPREGKNAFRNNHHFVFLSRQGHDLPFGFSAEIVEQSFYEVTARPFRHASGLRLSGRAGKILVLFGPDPLHHKSYGGLGGSDQRTLPAVWAAFGASARIAWRYRALSLADDLYCVQGFDLAARTRPLDMVSDLAAYDGARIALGNRLAVGLGPLSLWYSAYRNPLRFGRRLFMQAVDVALWRPSLPVLDRIAVGAGAVRAFVSADPSYGTAGEVPGAGAYYHFADYLWLRLYVFDWLYLVGRTGLATFDNHAGFADDGGRADARDGSHHTAGIVIERSGAQLGLTYQLHFEKTDERPDDLLRLTLSYAF
jgi:hypothetical protein